MVLNILCCVALFHLWLNPCASWFIGAINTGILVVTPCIFTRHATRNHIRFLTHSGFKILLHRLCSCSAIPSCYKLYKFLPTQACRAGLGADRAFLKNWVLLPFDCRCLQTLSSIPSSKRGVLNEGVCLETQSQTKEVSWLIRILQGCLHSASWRLGGSERSMIDRAKHEPF